jgi:ABC-type polysaccharide/polyol phosphate transport system ATPase subunit
MKRKIADLDATSKVHLRFALSYAIPFDCYLADSALIAGDDVFQAKLAALVAERRRTSGFFFVTKSRRLIREFAHMAGVIEDNRIVMYPTPEAAIAAFDRMDQSADSEDIPSDEA